MARKRISIERVVRVACPARGTLLASKRLDAYVSVLKWALELAQIPVAPELVDFLGEVARRRADPDKVPGLAAQIPDSPLIRWLHAADEPHQRRSARRGWGSPGRFGGDMGQDLLSDAFFWTDNDLVVQTRSMYGGSPRERDSTFVLDQGGKVSHFNYFSNAQTASAVVNALHSSARFSGRISRHRPALMERGNHRQGFGRHCHRVARPRPPSCLRSSSCREYSAAI